MIYNVPVAKCKFSLFPTPRITSLNINSLSYYATTGPSLVRQSKVNEILQHLKARSDLIALQETGLLPGSNALVLSSSFAGWGRFHNPYKKNVAGTSVLISPALMARYKVRVYVPRGLEGYVQVCKSCSSAITMTPLGLPASSLLTPTCTRASSTSN